MKKLSIVAVICIIAMLFASCSGSTPAPTEPNDTQKAAVLSIVKAAAGADYSDATELKLNGETTTTDALITALVTNFLTGTEFTISANVVKDFAAESLDPITSGKIDLSVEATIQGKATFTNPETPDVDITTATVTLKSSNTNLNATIGEEKYELTLDANINNKNINIVVCTNDVIVNAPIHHMNDRFTNSTVIMQSECSCNIDIMQIVFTVITSQIMKRIVLY